MTRITPEDVDWLERRLQRAVHNDHVQPDPLFVSRAREELMRTDIAPLRWSPTVLVAVAFAFSALAAALLLLMPHRSASSDRRK